MVNAFVVWEDRYSVGLEVIDKQHKYLFELTNLLYERCRQGDHVMRELFEETLHSMVEYVHVHFTTEEKLMEKSKYPEYEVHKKEHADFVRTVLQKGREFEDGKMGVPLEFVHFLRDWILSHIAVSDKVLAAYLINLKAH
jgi:hemerythrin